MQWRRRDMAGDGTFYREASKPARQHVQRGRLPPPATQRRRIHGEGQAALPHRLLNIGMNRNRPWPGKRAG